MGKEYDSTHVETNLEQSVWMATAGDAQEATAKEHSMTFWEGLKTHRLAVGWALAIYMAMVMESYDAALIGSFMAYPAFREKYGEYSPTSKDYQISAPWQSAMQLSSAVGTIIGIIINGLILDKWGYRKVLIVSHVIVTGFIFITFFAPNIEVLFVGEVLCGLLWGIFGVASTAYASEITPVVLRGHLQVFANLAAIIGQLISAGILQGLVDMGGQWSYRIPFAIQWAWPVPLAILTYFAPESPWWLVRKGKMEEAQKSLARLSNEAPENFRQTVAMMAHTDKLEKEINSGTSYMDCFRGSAARRTEIAAVISASDCLCGFAITSMITYFFEQAGISASDSYKLGLGTSAMAFVGTCLSWGLLSAVGRRTIALMALSILGTIMVIVGILATQDQTNNGIKWAQPILLMIWTFTYDLMLGPISYVMPTECSPTRLRVKTLGLGRNAYNLLNIVNAVATPYILNPDQANWKGKAGFLAGGITFCILVWAYFRLPETKGRTYEEIDVMFDQRVSARNFKAYAVDPYSGEDEKHVVTAD